MMFGSEQFLNRPSRGPQYARWLALSRALHADERFDRLYHRLSVQYQSPERSYHNFIHIAECLREWDRLRPRVVGWPEIEAAIWFHDAVYSSHAHDNEEQSARLMRAWFSECGIPESFADTVDRLIMVTRTHTPERGSLDEAVVADVDLAILGQDSARFDEYDRQVREEYSWVQQDSYCAGRAKVLEGFLGRDRIYSTDEMFARYERTARENLRRSLERLRQAP